MGWSFCSSHTTKQHIINELLSPRCWAPGTELIAHRLVGNHFWQVVKPLDHAPVITVTLLAYDRKEGCYGTKGIDESSGPSATDCPLAFLDLAPVAPHYGEAWRERVRAYHAARRAHAAKPAPARGTVLRLDGTEYRLAYPAGPRRGWICDRVADGRVFRMNASQVKQAERVSA